MPLLLLACATQPQQEAIKEDSTATPVEAVVNTSKVNEVATAPQAVLSLVERSQVLGNNEDYKGATFLLERAIRIAPRYPNSYYQLAEVRHLEGRQTQARSLAQKALSLGAQDDLLEAILLLLDKIAESESL